MPNYCDYEMKIKGSKEAINRVVNCLKAEYNYGAGKPEHKHFFRIFEAYVDDEMEKNDDGTFTQFVSGYCAWSVYSCMCSGEHTYYSDCKDDFGKDFMGTTLFEQSEDCEIEVFSEEDGMEFSEHYIFKKGRCVLDDCVKISYTNDDDYVCLNPHREAPNDVYRWEI